MGTMQIQNLTCSYNGQSVLKEFSLSVEPGQVLILIGPNGAGKTTLLRAVARLLRPRLGTVLLDGQDVWRLPPRDLARQLALAPQTNGLSLPLTVDQAIVLGRAPHRGWLLPFSADDRAVVNRVLRQTGLLALRDRRLTDLSGGEQRRVILARALVQEPLVLLMDEPTANLDMKYQAEILDLVRGLAHNEGLTVIITLHDVNHAALYADRLALLAEGRLLAVGEPADVLIPSRLEQAYSIPVIVTRHPLYDTPMVMPIVNRDAELMNRRDRGRDRDEGERGATQHAIRNTNDVSCFTPSEKGSPNAGQTTEKRPHHRQYR